MQMNKNLPAHCSVDEGFLVPFFSPFAQIFDKNT